MSIRKSDRIISVEHVSKYFGEKAVLNDVNLQVRKGEFVTILGPSGCGKTTLLRLIAGFQTASEGVITMSGKEITQTPPHKRPVNTVFQSFNLIDELNVYENVELPLTYLGFKASAPPTQSGAPSLLSGKGSGACSAAGWKSRCWTL